MSGETPLTRKAADAANAELEAELRRLNPDIYGLAAANTVLAVFEHVARLEKAVATMAWWLVEAQTGFGQRDAEGIERILRGETA